MPESVQSNEEKMVVPNYKRDNFDKELFKKCFAKHGFKYIKHNKRCYHDGVNMVKFAILGTSEESGGIESII
jgi:hypothetical protein